MLPLTAFSSEAAKQGKGSSLVVRVSLQMLVSGNRPAVCTLAPLFGAAPTFILISTFSKVHQTVFPCALLYVLQWRGGSGCNVWKQG